MPRILRRILVTIILSLTTVSLHAQTPAQRTAASAFLDALFAREWQRVEALEHRTLRDKIPVERWTELLDGLEQRGGRFLQHTFFSAEPNASYASIVHRVHFEKDSIAVRVVVDSLNLIGGLWLEPIKKDYRFPPPAYADTAAFTEIDLNIGTEFPLEAVLTIPNGEGPFPALVLVHGSGPSDRDQTIGGNKIFRDIAWGLASRGIMVLRYDKRTKVYGANMDRREVTVQNETIDDALLALELLNARPKTDTTRLILLGHSLGAGLAPEIAVKGPDVDGVVMLAPFARPLEVVIADQLRYIASQQDTLTAEEEIKLRNELDKAAQIQSEELMKSKTLLGMPASYYYDLHTRDQNAFAQQLSVPMFLARGSKDYQTSEMEILLWKQWLAGREDVVFRRYENCFHLFIETEATPGPWNYQQEGHVTKALIDDLSAWCRSFTLSRHDE
ncbi:MAG: alpha/beta fold hydrolase [Bacteroidetes bacterium]|nr:alpha/beta fold hydrolase [Bacteroidota bacterium]